MLLPLWAAAVTWVWISRLPRVPWSTVLCVMTGTGRAPGGRSHSCVTATRGSPNPRARTISVALGSSEQMRIYLSAQRGDASVVYGTQTVGRPVVGLDSRSEEHTSELQSRL